uniref:Potassium/proton antiporter CemA n=1 Tax=Spirogyra maxima TaxID=3180 RepID=A0A191T4D7_SPIMX|nr:chloroplast enveloppe membrane protein [Spirogyra maxima]ANI25257.1 chloroplast enveloppe membrane protein [Spirogyra maxima]
MQSIFFLSFYKYLLEISYRALHKAYEASKKVRDLQKNYLSYKTDKSYRRSAENVALYMNTTINKLESEIYWKLVEFKITQYLISILIRLCSTLSQEKISFYEFYSSTMNNSRNFIKVNRLKKRLAWIEAVLSDLQILKRGSWNEINNTFLKNSFKQSTPTSWLTYLTPKPKSMTYDSVGLVPRSIIRTISRFNAELRGQSASLVISEFRLAKYQAVASLQYLGCLIFLPWIISTLSKKIFFEPFAENWWNTSHFQIFLCVAQEEKALEELKNLEELLWLDTIMTGERQNVNDDLITHIRLMSMKLADKYNNDSIHTIIHPFTDLVAILTIGLLLIWGKKRLTILNSWAQEVFHSLSDTMKAFLIVFLADLCIGFHSRHGWEVLTRLFLDHLGFPYSQHLISCFTSIAPVILHTLFKYWVFRDLSRISPSIVANYDAMNE